MVSTTKKASKKVVSTGAQAAPSAWRNLLDRLTQPTTIAGLLTIGATVATGGTAGWLNADTLPALLSGLGLMVAPDRSILKR